MPNSQKTHSEAETSGVVPFRPQHGLGLALAVGYFAIFYRWDHVSNSLSLPPDPAAVRWLRLSYLLIPDVLVEQWVAGDFSHIGFWDRIPVLLAAVLILLVATAAGAFLLTFWPLQRGTSRLELFLFSIGVGLNVLSLGTLALGLAGLLESRLIFLLVAVVIVSAAAWRKSALKALYDAARESDVKTKPSSWPVRYAFFLTVPFVLVIMAGSVLPPWHFDVREYHAQVPKEWYQAGEVQFLPHNVYGNMPLGAEMHLVLGMLLSPGAEDWWWGTLIGKLVIGLYSGLTALAIFAFGRRYFSPSAGAAAAFVWISTPWVAHVSMAGLIEGPSAFYYMMTFLALRRWFDAPMPDNRVDAAWSGFLAGAAVACKYPAVLFVAIPAGGVLVLRMLHRRKFDVRTLAFYGLALAAGCGLWFGKNVVLTGNPTYPLLVEWFDGETRTAEKDEQWSRAHRAPEHGFTLAAAWQGVKLVLIGSEWASPLLIPFAFIGLWSRQHWRTIAGVVALMAFVILSWWMLTHRLDRFLLPILPFAALLAGRGLTLTSAPWWKMPVSGLMLVAFVINLTLVSSPSIGDARLLVPLADFRESSYDEIDQFNPHLPPSHIFLNEAVQPGFRVLLCGEAQVFDLEVPLLYNTCFDDCVFEQLVRGKSKEARAAALRELRISHVLVNWKELDRYRSPGNYGYPEFITREFVRQELVADQQLLRLIGVGSDADNIEIYEVVGWRD